MTSFEPPEIDEVRVLWRDEHALVVDKPWGVLVHNSAFAGPKERSLKQALEAQEGPPLQPLHRLDRGTSGATVFLRDARTQEDWRAALEAGAKVYLAVVRGHATFPETVIERPLRDERGVEQPARSVARVVAQSPVARCSLVEVKIETGRTHQIRRHLSGLHHPVVGDTTHGDTKFNRAIGELLGRRRLLLHAWTLHLRHPVTGALHQWTADLTGEREEDLVRLFPDTLPLSASSWNPSASSTPSGSA